MDFRVACCAALLLFAPPAAAQEAFIKGVYSTPEGCAALKAGKQEEDDYIFLSATGVQSVEFNCEFVQVYPRKSSPGWAAVAFCEEPGLSYPTLFSLLPLDDTSLHLGTLDGGGGDDEAEADDTEDGAEDTGLDGDYQLCDAGGK